MLVNVKRKDFKIKTRDIRISSLPKYFILFLIFLTCDQVSKIWIRKLFATETYKEPLNIIGNFFRISFVENPGAVFGISIGTNSINRILFTAISFLAVGFIIYLFYKSDHPAPRFGLTLILSGAIGNLIDRIAFGKVTDFLDIDFPNFIMQRWYTFNIADSCIVVGVIILMIYYTFFENTAKHKTKSNKEKE